MTALSRAVALIKQFEGCKLRAYLCPANVPTIGWGATGTDIGLGLVWTQDQADNRLLIDASRFERGVKRALRVPADEGQLAAMTSFAYNVGLKAFEKSTLLRKFNTDDAEGAAKEFDKWVRGGGKVLPGLVKRRAAERKVFEGG